MVEKRNPVAADRVIMAIRDACSRAGLDPGIGRRRKAINPGLHNKLVRRYPYTIFYRLARTESGFSVEVLRILHQRSDTEAALADLG
jgi:plasmid stabilization system protein ParE